jgi:endonuclease/exonuclease/phosphatase family metal-dependent hydrolase
MYKHLTLYLALVCTAVCFASCASLQFYNKSDAPFYQSNKEIDAQSTLPDSISVVTFNIKKARKIQLAIDELQQLRKQKEVDIYLLQEMDEQGTEAIASAMHLNYLYIPISYDRSDKKNIGNAILTRGTITNPEKLILPHAKWQNQQRRDVTIGEVTIHDKKILVFSAHTETFAMSRKDRMDQVDAIISREKILHPEYKYVVVGGDFNTVFSKDAAMVVQRFNNSGFNWPTSEVGCTAKGMLGLVKPTNDYLFTRGLKLVNAYALNTSRSSDHYPVVATFSY